MAYEIYKKVISKKDYFNNWTHDEYEKLTDELKNQIYQKYLLKQKVLNRDNFRCQNKECKTPESPLTLHHIKFQKNGGKNTERNGVTLCRSCHKAFHRAKKEIVFENIKTLPPHIKGHTFKLDKPDTINWKKIKFDMRQLRKSLKNDHINLSWKQIEILMKWITFQYNQDDD